MDSDLLREIAREYLLPFFSGARLEEDIKSSSGIHETVALQSPLTIAFKVNKSDPYRLHLFRSQPFTSKQEVVVSELDVVQAFVDVLGSIEEIVASDLRHDILSTFERRVVARAVRGAEYEKVILSGIDQLASWGNRLYEGSPISASIGFRKTTPDHRVTLEEIAKEDFSAVLSNGYDTLMSFSFDGQLVSYETLSEAENLPSYCPMRQAALAEWTTKRDTRVALSLNRLAEILIFRDEQLIFARRSGRWHFLTHAPVIAQMRIPRDRKLRVAIYETALDASFARSGACIGVISQKQEGEWVELVARRDDHLFPNSSLKARAINLITKGKKFAELDRRTRLELAAIDGATVLSHAGEILAVGAILKLAGGSTGGGRLAAAKALATKGLGVKISQDGGIIGFRGKSEEPAFRVM